MERPNHRHARRTLLWSVVAFALVQGCLLLLGDNWFPQWRDPIYGLREVLLEKRLATAQHKTGQTRQARLIVCLGSSRVLNGFAGVEIEERLDHELGPAHVAFVIGVPGGGPVRGLLSLQRLLASHLEPQMVLVEALPLTLHAGRTPVETLGEKVENLSWQDLCDLEKTGLPVAELRKNWLRQAPVPAHYRRFTMLQSLAPAFLPPGLARDQAFLSFDDSGCSIMPKLPPEVTRYAHDKALAAYSGIKLSLGGLPVQALEIILQECRRRHIAVAMLVTPESPQFQGVYTSEDWRCFHDLIDGLSRKYEVPVVDARNWVPEAEFFDGLHHVDARGASTFSKHLTERFLLPFWRGQVTPPGYADRADPPASAGRDPASNSRQTP
jgi:hypothetical protein